MNKSEDLQSRVGSRGSREDEVEALASSNRATIALTDDLKNDSLLNPQKERRSTDGHRNCRCSQLKKLKEKTLERIRMSMELENERRSTIPDEKSKGLDDPGRQGSINESKIVDNAAGSTTKSLEPKESLSTIKSNRQSSLNDQRNSKTIDAAAVNTKSDSKTESLEPKESPRVSSINSDRQSSLNQQRDSKAIDTGAVNAGSGSKRESLESPRISSIKSERQRDSKTIDIAAVNVKSEPQTENLAQKEPIRVSSIKSPRQSSINDDRNSKTLDAAVNIKSDSKADSLKSKESKISSSKLPAESEKSSTSVVSEIKTDSMIRRESKRISAKLLAETGKPYRISDFPPVRQSIRISMNEDDDIFEDLDKFHQKEQERVQAKKSSRESRYTEIFSNDIFGSIEQDLIGDQDLQYYTARRSTLPVAENQLQSATRRSTAPINAEDGLQRRSTGRSSKIQRYTEIYGNDMMGCILEVPNDNEEPVKDSNRSSKEQRYSDIYDNDMFGMPVDLRESDEFLNRDQLKLVTLEPVIYVETPEEAKKFSSHLIRSETVDAASMKSSIQESNLDPRLSTKVPGSVELIEKVSQAYSSRGSIVTIPQTKFDHRRSTVQQRYTEIFDNDMFGGIEQQMDMPGTPSSSAGQSIALDLQSRASKYSKISNNDLSGFINEVTTAASEIAASSSKIKQQDVPEQAPTRHSCSQKIKICSDSCTSHLQPHQCSLVTPLCTASCMTCKPFTDSNAQYDADDERSSMLIHGQDPAKSSSSSTKPQEDQTMSSKIQNPEHVCSCYQKYPELFDKVLSK
ncbi:uncharacterized protein [Chironomus tepperi]|uniref:uncharacterized protein n=1 Tax=Chironomus tepperi TaxID=113505 RepID=UPI00391F20DC